MTDAASDLPLLVLSDNNPAASIAGIASLPYSRLVIAHTESRRSEAQRLAEVAAQIHPDRPAAELVDCGKAVDFEPVAKTLASLGLSAPYRLDYTGGNRVQVVCGVWQHLDDHADHPRAGALRSYRDVFRQALIRDEPDIDGAATIPIAKAELTLARLAHLEGYRLEGASGPIRLRPDADPVWVERNLTGLLRRLTGERTATTDAVCQAADRLMGHFTGMPDNPWSDNPGKRLGIAAEVLVAAFIAAGVAPGRNDVEVIAGAKAVSLSKPAAAPPTAELDVVVRVGGAVRVIEVKSAAQAVSEVFTWRDSSARLVFGSEVALTMVAVRGGGYDRLRHKRPWKWSERLPRLTQWLSAPIKSRSRAEVVHLTDRHAPARLKAIGTAAPEFTPPPAPVVRRGPAPDLLVCALGARGAVVAAAAETEAHRVALLTVPDEDHDLPVLPHVESYPIVADAMTADIAYQAASDTRPPILSVVSGPKSASAGFLRYVHENPDADLVLLDRLAFNDSPRRVHQGNPARGWEIRPRRHRQSWEELLPAHGYQRFDGSASPVVRRVIEAAKKRDISVWSPPATEVWGPDTTHLLLAGAHVTASVTVIELGRRAPKPRHEQAKYSVLDFEAAVESSFGAVNRNVVVIPAGFLDEPQTGRTPQTARADSWAVLLEENDWLEFGTWTRRRNDVVVELPERLWTELSG